MKIKFRFTKIKTKLLLIGVSIVSFLIYQGLRFSCPMKTILGIPCAGCGMTRAYRAVLAGDFASAFSHHMMFWAMPVLLIYFLFDFPVVSKKADVVFLSFIIAGFLINWVISIVNYV